MGKGKYKLNKGFSLAEILIYVTVIAVVGAFLGGIFLNTVKIQNRQSATNEVDQQLTYVLETVQRYVRDSSYIDIATSTPVETLTLKMQDETKTPTLIYLSGGQVFFKEGSSAAVALTSASVSVDNLKFTKIANYGGHDMVQVDLQISYVSNNSEQSFSKSLTLAIARVNAATFDSSVLPGADDTYDVGLSSPRWRNAYFSGTLSVTGATTLSNTLGVAGTTTLVTTGGNVGIGTTSPVYKLDVDTGIIKVSDGSKAIKIGGFLSTVDATYISSSANYLGFLANTGAALPLKAASLALTSSFTNDAPANGLYVQGNINATGTILVNGNATISKTDPVLTLDQTRAGSLNNWGLGYWGGNTNLYLKSVTANATFGILNSAGTSYFNVDSATGNLGLNAAAATDRNLYINATSTNANSFGIHIYGVQNINADVTKYNRGIYVGPTYKVSSGVTNLGWWAGQQMEVLRSDGTNDSGTLAGLYGITLSYGNYTSTGVTTEAFGINIGQYLSSGTISTSYGIKIGTPTAGARSAPLHYGLYIADQANASTTYPIYQTGTSGSNYFNANTGIATTSPWRTLSVVGTMSVNGLTTNTGISTASVCLSSTNEIVKNTDNETCLASSKRFKHNINPLLTGSALDIISQLHPVTFEYNAIPDGERYGFIAEDVEKIDKRLIGYDDKGLPNSVRYTSIIPLLTQTAQELNAKLENQNKEIQELKTEIEQLKKGF